MSFASSDVAYSTFEDMLMVIGVITLPPSGTTPIFLVFVFLTFPNFPNPLREGFVRHPAGWAASGLGRDGDPGVYGRRVGPLLSQTASKPASVSAGRPGSQPHRISFHIYSWNQLRQEDDEGEDKEKVKKNDEDS